MSGEKVEVRDWTEMPAATVEGWVEWDASTGKIVAKMCAAVFPRVPGRMGDYAGAVCDQPSGHDGEHRATWHGWTVSWEA